MAEDGRIDELYDLPLDEFTAARNELAKELRSSDREEAERIKGLRKPSAAAWALNQSVRRDPARLKEFLEAAAELRDAHEALLEGGEREALEAATARERQAAHALADAAEEVAGGGGPGLRGKGAGTLRAAVADDEARAALAAGRLGGGGPGLRDRVAGPLRAAVADDEARAELESGRLVREREAVGLGLFGGAPVEGARKRSPKVERQRAARKELDEARQRQQRAQRRARDAGQSVAAARERAEAAMETLERAQREEEQARAGEEESAAEVERLARSLNG